ncbi:hypothetical protein, conserved [Babesia bigemina]|uniref:Uncharacterized protein n=1 Tax=Babesia bigemina TaxID=5866 RepID=A0A061D628_BABBI|nr:hypothetical protein, conserved [Babesia bigemina]CDR95472.1 hypothetical protein, conserved [Babesia bigemina]|eukprot:XP_012767658.1 hypothetical protein, conserved [Babesia bigemina]
MADEPGAARTRRPSSGPRKAPIVDNFVLMFYNKDGSAPAYSSADCAGSLSSEASFREKVRDYLERIKELRREITDKYHAKKLTEDKMQALLFELRVQSRFSALNVKKRQAVKVHLQRKLLLCEKIYLLTIRLQKLYIELAELVDSRASHCVQLHRTARRCASALYEHRRRMAAT